MTSQYNVPLGYAQARFLFSVAGLTDAMGFTVGVFSPTLGPALTASNLAILFSTHVLDDGAFLGSDWSFDGCDLTTQLQGGPSIDQSAGSVQGTDVLPTVPPNCAMLVRKNTALGGRKNRGRIYAPAGLVAEANIGSSGFLGGGNAPVFTARWMAWFDAIVALDITPFLFHQYDPDLGELPEIPTEITSLQVQPQLATQRNRMR